MVRSRSRALRGLLAMVAVVAGLMVAPAPASAHDELTSTNPADGSTVTTRVEEVTLTFSGVVRADGSTVTVTGPDGIVHSDGPVTVLDTVVHQRVAALSSGAYRVQWRVVAGDGDPMNGEFGFTLALPAEPTATTPPPATSAAPTTSATEPAAAPTSGSAAWVWWLVAAAVVVVALAAVLALLRRRRGRP